MTPRMSKFAFAALALFLTSSLLSAQEHEGSKTAWELFQSTGWVGMLLVGVSMLGTYFSIENFASITREKLAPPQIVDELDRLIQEEDYDGAIELATEDGSYLSILVSAALRMRHAGYEEMIGFLEQASAEQTFGLSVKISYMSLLGNMAPLLGLLGTVTGMITSFQKIEQMAAPKPKDLASGVYESLVNTTMGLFLAIVFLTSFFFLKNRVTKLSISITLQGVDMLKHLAGKAVH
ncbi:MAG: MotA/TolQ/ExbB proton channel family protein [Planctomycetes bacterium]|nr:MotA/TolQ/ExbB proton channel family protein [Planctomycetota bacterium]